MLRLAIILLLLANALLLVLDASRRPEGAGSAGKAPAPDPMYENIVEIRLLSELDDGAEFSGRNAGCFTIGPLADIPTLERVSSGLRRVGTSVVARRIETPFEKGFWVYLPPLASSAEARDMARAMRDAGLSDVTTIGAGEWLNSISLGYIASKRNAQARREEARKLGFEAEIRPQVEYRPRFWVDYQQRKSSPLASVFLADVIDPALHEPVECPGAR